MKTILITGSEGFIGSNLIESFQHEFRIVGIDRKFQSELNKERKYKYIYLDMMEFDEFSKLKGYEFDYIIHLAAIPGVRYSIRHPHRTIDTNYTVTLNLLNWYMKVGCNAPILYASSSSVYGAAPLEQWKSFNERTILTDVKISPYAQSKILCENLFQERQTMIQSCGLRLFNVYGPDMRLDLAIPCFIRDIRAQWVSSVAPTIRDYTYILDVIKAIRVILKDGIKCSILNIGRGNPISMEQLYKMIADSMGVKYNYEMMESVPEGDMERTCCDNSLLRKLYDVDITTDVHDVINYICATN